MSTCNFWNNEDGINLYAMSNDDLCKTYINDVDDDGNEITEYSDEDLFWAQTFFDDEFKNVLEDFADGLKWYNITLKSGYYDGVQLYIVSKWLCIDDWDDDDAQDEFDLSLAELKEMIEAEKKSIEDFQEHVATEYGFRKIYCLGVFSNGEAVYKYAD